ncbi:hypothetical protein ACFS7Z_20935 [Pontibacter toksunensis]|uniref:DNA-directed RNA polymerase subunit omega n=1 Tax=Pontibacter toksunensis TaxID=1332631 RepID=A0ABW6C0S6_9BACT
MKVHNVSKPVLEHAGDETPFILISVAAKKAAAKIVVGRLENKKEA